MRNLKKILALVLALVMSFSLMATANAFTDSEKVTDTYETAVTVLDGLKVFQGYEDGSFKPQDPISRKEVAAIIYRIVTGDVTDSQVGIYADYNKFDDVKSTSWYAGYVNFCANAEYIKGRDARTFDPDAYVTGYEALAMILRAIGYDKNGEFTGSSWQVQTAATGELRGITKNITAGTLGTAASREVVAEILFQTILVDKVNYTPAFGYQLDDTSLGWDTFELEDIEGVVIANEYADLYATKPLKAGKTELDVDGDSYTLAYTTTLEDIGEARHAYITEGENVLYLADAGNTVFETGAATDIEKDKDFEKATGLERDEDITEEFVNFDNAVYEYVTDIRIAYQINNDDGSPVKSGHFDKDETLDADEVEILEAIFRDDDENDGWIVVGTKALSQENDVSDDMTWREFVEKYFIDTDKQIQEVNESDNGEWLKVIDNDGDGVADYVFLTEFAMSVINRISKDNEYTLADLAATDDVTFVTDDPIDGDDIVTEDELAEDDVVIYTLIDGNYYMSIAEMVTETIDAGKTAINSKTETITCDGTDYVQSHIGYTDKSVYEYDVTEAETETTYDLYLDYFGYVRLFVESDYNVFMLLTDGWYEDDNRTETFQAYYWDVEAGEETLIDVVDNNDASDFIADYNWTGYWGDQETWGRLLGADVTYRLNAYDRPNTFATNIAGYGETADGYALKKVQDSTSREDYLVQEFVVDKNVSLKETYLEASDPHENDIQTTTNTQYYLVIRDKDTRTVSGWDVDDVITWTGYKNAPDGAKLNRDDIVVGYAVTHVTKSGSGSYNVADVVVFETKASTDQDTYFVYARNNSRIEHVWGIGYNEDGAIEDQRLNAESGIGDMIRFYEIDDDAVADEIGTAADPKGDYADHYIYAGYATTDWDIEDVDYVQVDTLYGKMNVELDAPIFKLTRSSDGTYDVEEMDRDDVHYMDAVIVFTDDEENVEYAIWVGTTVNYLSDPGQYVVTGEFTALNSLWKEIWDDARYADYNLTINNYVVGEGVSYILRAVAGTGADIVANVGNAYTVTPGTYTLTVTVADGYDTDYFVTNNKQQMTPVAAGVYEIEITDSAVLVEIAGAGEATGYTVKYDANAADVANPVDGTWRVTEADTFELATVTRTGYTFAGWANAAGVTVEADDITVDSFGTDGALTLYAQWTPIDVTVSVKVTSSVNDQVLDNLCFTAREPVEFGDDYSFALSDPSYTYAVEIDGVESRFSAGNSCTITVDSYAMVDGVATLVIDVTAYPATYGDASALLNGLVARYNALMADGLIADELDDAQALLEDMNDVSQDVIDMATEEEQAAFNAAKTGLATAIDELRQQIADDEQAAEDAEILRKATLESVVVKGIEVAMDDDQTGNDGMAQTSAYTYTLTLTESELADLQDTTSLSIVVTPRNEDHAVTITTTQGAAWDLEATTIDRGYYWYVICNNVYFDVIVEVVADPDPEPTEVDQALAAAAAIEEVTVDNYDEAKELCDVTLENLINAGSTTADEKADLEEAQAALAEKIEAYETIRDNLETAQTNALAELAAYYNTMQPAEVEAARGAYLAAMDAINGAADPDAVDDALAAGIADMADAAGVEAVDKADALLNAGVVLDEVVAILLDDLTDENGNLPDEVSVKTIGDALWNATSEDETKLGDGQVIPALVANEIPVDRIYADYLADGSKTVEGITTALAGTEGLESETIVDAYVNYWLSIGDTEEGNGLTGVIVEAGDLEDDRSRDFTVTLTSEDYDIDGTGLAEMVRNSGVDVDDDITIWRSTDNWTASEADSLSEFIAMVKPDSDGNIPEDGMVARVIAGTDYYLEITIGEMTYHVTLTYEAAEAAEEEVAE